MANRKRCDACLSITTNTFACHVCGFILDPEDPSQHCPRFRCHQVVVGESRFCEKCHYPLPLAIGSMAAGRFRVEKVLWRGGEAASFGQIYLVHDLEDNCQVALREFTRCDVGSFQLGLHQFKNAYWRLQILQASPMVPRVHECIVESSAAYIVCEYLPGPDLGTLMDQRAYPNPFPIDKVIEWGKSLCDLLTLMHQQQPRQLKLSIEINDLLLDRNGELKATNFGLARCFGPSPTKWPVSRSLV